MLSALKARLATSRGWLRRGRLARYLFARFLSATHLSRHFTIARDGYRLRFHPSALSVTLWTDPNDRDQDLQVLRQVLNPGDSVIDVGANIGDLSLCAASLVGPRGIVYAIEPHPRTFRYLEENIQLNGFRQVVPLCTALGASSGSVSFSDRRSDDQNVVVAGSGPLSVPVQRLDSIEIREGPIRLCKIDVEGYEPFVLEGAGDLLKRIETIYFEAWDAHFKRHGSSTPSVLRWLAQRGFEIYSVTSGLRLEPVPIDTSAEQCTNFLAVSRTASTGRFRRPKA